MDTRRCVSGAKIARSSTSKPATALPTAQKMDLSSMMHDFFGVSLWVLPDTVAGFHRLYGKDLNLPENPYVKGKGRYIAFDTVHPFKTTIPRISEQIFRRNYVSQTTGMFELRVHQRIPTPEGATSDNPYPGYEDEGVPIPDPLVAYDAMTYSEVDGVFVPNRIVATSFRGFYFEERYSHVKIKRLV